MHPDALRARLQDAPRIRRARERALAVPGSGPALTALGRDRSLGGRLLAAALAFRLFAMLLPMALLLVVALDYAATVDRSAPQDAGAAVGIGAATMRSISQASKVSQDARWLLGAFALVMIAYSAASAAKTMHAAHSLAWTGAVEPMRRPLGAALRLIVTILALGAIWGAVGKARAEFGVLGVVLAIAATIPFGAVWLLFSTTMPHDDAPWSALLPGAVLVGVGFEVIHAGTVLFIGHRIEHASATYGPLGAAFTILVWLFIIGRVVVLSSVLNAVVWNGRRAARTTGEGGVHPCPPDGEGGP